MKPGQAVKELNGKIVDKIYLVDFNQDRETDNHLPWVFFFVFSNADKFMEIEGDFDGIHIRIRWHDVLKLTQRLQQYDRPGEPDLWQIYRVEKTEKLGKILNERIDRVAYGVDKDEFEINATRIKGEKDLYTFVKFIFNGTFLTILEGGTGLFATDDPAIKPYFEETFDVFDTGA